MANNQGEIEKAMKPFRIRKLIKDAAVYSLTYETLEDIIITRIRDFYSTGYENGHEIISESYHSEVLEKDSKKKPLNASILWLSENGVIDEIDIGRFWNCREHRNQIVHELSGKLLDLDYKLPVEEINEMIALVEKIERWWILNVEIPTNPDPIEGEIDEEGVKSGLMLLVNFLKDFSSLSNSRVDIKKLRTLIPAEWQEMTDDQLSEYALLITEVFPSLTK